MESLVTPIPGPHSYALATRLRATETRGVTYLADDFPVFWRDARGATVADVDGNRYLDFTSAFGVAVTGHANPAVARAIATQAQRLPHGMGDVHPSDVKADLLDALARIAPMRDPKTFLASSGAEAVEFALKTAMLATGDANVLSFAGGYHGLSYGTLEVTGISKFRKPWERQLRGTTTFTRFPDPREPKALEKSLAAIRKALKKDRAIGAVIVEPIQGRAGVVVPPEGFLSGLRALCTQLDVLLILDEIYTGFARTGTMFACERENVEPDILCIGKALAGGFPLSAAIVRGDIADAWDVSRGEALHTSTYLGNPMGCAAALANLGEIERLRLIERARTGEAIMRDRLHALRKFDMQIADIRGRGMLWALEFKDPAFANASVLRALQRGLILLQSGTRGESISLSPPLVITDAQLHRAFDLLEESLRDPLASSDAAIRMRRG
jgi:4-aminobutyrate aminotransferase-like enzyme